MAEVSEQQRQQTLNSQRGQLVLPVLAQIFGVRL